MTQNRRVVQSRFRSGRRPTVHFVGLVLAIAFVAQASFVAAAEPSAEDAQFFETKIRPILVENCQRCHGEKKQSGGLRLDGGASLLSGGDSGPALVPGEPAKSLLVEAINYESLEMPPDARLKPEQIALLTRWIKLGAPWPGSSDAPLAPRKGGLVVTDADRQHWSFQPIRRPQVVGPQVVGPQVVGTLRVPSSREGGTYDGSPSEPTTYSPIDGFIAARLSEKGLVMSPPANRRQVIRRLMFDLIGLPPSFEQVEEFAADERPDAYERLADRLLASPRYGERWARHWLDVVRFAQTNGYERDSEKPNAWRYRDYVIGALNADKPYDQFLIEQLAGDELEPLTDDSLAATAFFRLGVWDDEPDDGKQAKADEFDDIVSTTGSAMLGLTLGCARCHDHKFDPIGQEDYYSFTAFFQNIHLYGKVADIVGGGQPVDKEGVFRQLPSGAGETLCVRERQTPPPESYVLIRGNAHTPGKSVEPRFIEVLSRSKNDMLPEFPEASGSDASPTSGRRLALARWIASGNNPLTARVAVNRLWQHHFGRGLVATPSDFGRTGAAPTHPELLDFLASELIDGNWQLKHLHRAIVSSATYRQSSQIEDSESPVSNSAAPTNPQSAIRNPQSIDPDNSLLWRQNLRRLEAEPLRDAILAASGQLSLEMNGRGIFPTLPSEVLEKQSRPGNGWENKSPLAQQARRSVYIFVKRTLGVPILESFDVASPDIPIAERSTTTVAPQALILLNSEFMQQQATALAERVGHECKPGAGDQIAALYRIALSRKPTPRELSVASDFLNRRRDDSTALVELCKLILNLNEFVYID